jgi:hypothetical protein
MSISNLRKQINMIRQIFIITWLRESNPNEQQTDIYIYIHI